MTTEGQGMESPAPGVYGQRRTWGEEKESNLPMPELVYDKSQGQLDPQAGNYAGYLQTAIGSKTPVGEFGI